MTPETKLTVETTACEYQPDSLLSFHHANREVLRITHDGRMICGEHLSTEEATQEAAKMLVDAFEQEIQKMVDARIATMKEGEAKGYLERAQKAEAQLHALTLICGTSDANKFQSWVDREREKVRVLRDALERRHTEQGYHRQYVDDVLDATKEASK